jgi:hypothetical protein
MNIVHRWSDDFGEYEIPDFHKFFTKRGWFDRRRKVTPSLKAYFDANLKDRLSLYKAGVDLDTWKAPRLPDDLGQLVEK